MIKLPPTLEGSDAGLTGRSSAPARTRVSASPLLKIRPFDIVGLLEAAREQQQQPDSSWLDTLLARIAPGFGANVPLVGFTYRLTGDGILDPLTLVGRNAAPELLEMWRLGCRWVPREFVERNQVFMNCATLSELFRRGGEGSREVVALFHRTLAPFGARDAFAFGGHDPEGLGVNLCVLLGRTARARNREIAVLGRAGAHLATTFRLRRKLATEPAPAAALGTSVEAVLTPAGKVVHAEEPAKAAAARDLLEAAVRSMEDARAALRRSDPEGAVAQWKPLVGARWTLVDSFESDGRRYVLARENRAQVSAPQGLTERERQVLAHAQLGHSAKEIAYELGIADSTVRVLLHRVAGKLGWRAQR